MLLYCLVTMDVQKYWLIPGIFMSFVKSMKNLDFALYFDLIFLQCSV